MHRSHLAIVIPAFNEAATIGAVVKMVSEAGIPVVIDDASTDETSQAATDAGADVVRHETNRRYDAALSSGFAHVDKCGFHYAITFDADGQHDAALLSKYKELLDAGNFLVAGIRPKSARLAEALFAGSTRLLYGLDDPLCGMKGYDLNVYRLLGHFDRYGSIGTELALFAVRNGFPFVQVPVPIHERVDAPRGGVGLGLAAGDGLRGQEQQE